jgi:putative ABC transport system permease protein
VFSFFFKEGSSNMNSLRQDLRFGLRLLLRNPGFTAVAILTLALGIGANTAIFSVVNAVILRPLPYRDPARLVRVYSEFPTMNLRRFWISSPEFMDIQKEAKSWESIGAWAMGGVNVGTAGEPLRVTAAAVTRGLIDTLGVTPTLGRNFTLEEDVRGGPNVAIISDGLWRRAFGGTPDIIGKTIQVDGQNFSVIGVMPADFSFPPGANDPAEVWTSFQFDPANPGNRAGHYLSVIGKLKPGVAIDQARSEISMLMGNWDREKRAPHLLKPELHPILMSSLHEEVVSGARTSVLLLMAAVAFVLLIACVNVASLLLARAEARHREFAVRLALGAGRGRMIRQFLIEGLLLVVVGAFLGTMLAVWGLKLLIAFAPDSVPRTNEIGVDLAVLAFTLGISMFAVLFFALAPLAQVRDRNLADWLRGAGLRTSTSAAGQRLRQALVIIEIALAVVLVVVSGLMLRAFWKLQQVDLGFDPTGVVAFRLELPGTKYQTPDRLRFLNTMQERLAALPGVKGAAASSGFPPLRPINANDTDIEDYKPQSKDDPTSENVDYWNIVTEDYFKVLGIKVVEGRAFTMADRDEKGQRVAVINQALARRYWKGSPIGRRLSPGGGPNPTWFTIVGVVSDAKNAGVDEKAGTELYLMRQQVAPVLGVSNTLNFVVSASGDTSAIIPLVRAMVRELDPSVPIYEARPMIDQVAQSLVRPRFLSLLLGIFAALALTLAAVGIYGVMSYAVARRTQELGIRMALGAQKSDVLKLVLRQGLGLMGIGTGVGLAIALALTRFITTLLYGVTASDPVTYASVVGLLGAVALLATYVPARRATRVDPMIALRYE